MDKQAITTTAAPKAIGPYSQAIKAGGWLYLSGQIPIDPKTNQLVLGTIEEQTERVLKNAQGVLEAAGASLQNVVKVTLFLANMQDFPKVNETYSKFFKSVPPSLKAITVG